MINDNTSEVIVSICCTAYNLEKYIDKAISSFLMQKTNFRYEIIIGEDCSSDNTREIVNRYSAQYPDLVTIVFSEKNVGTIKNYLRVLEKARGKYIAICDGDDYWTDPLKLQKQVDFLESESEYVICCHYSNLINERGEVTEHVSDFKPLIYSYHDVLIGKREQTRNSSMMIRNNSEFRKIILEEWILKCFAQDRFLKLYATWSTGKLIYVMPELMSYYRVHEAGTSQAGIKVLGPKNRSDFNLMIKNFTFPNELRQELLSIYLKRFFLYDIRTINARLILSTLKTLT